MRVWSAVTDGGATAGNEWREHATVENGFVRPQESGEPPKVLQRSTMSSSTPIDNEIAELNARIAVLTKKKAIAIYSSTRMMITSLLL